jgi:hypothetical protein
MDYDYSLRGKCKELSEALIVEDPTLTLVRGYYHCPFWGKQEHWWCKSEDGNIIDPTKDQFPSKGIGEYEEFNGICECETCGKEVPEEKVQFAGRYPCCSYECCMKLVL